MTKSITLIKRLFLKKRLISLALAVLMVTTSIALAGCENGKDGTNGTDGATWLAGVDAPTANQGKNGDFYLDTDDRILYQKSNELWEIMLNDFGKPGNDGTMPEITVNEDGYWVINGIPTATKAQGTIGPAGSTPTVSINDEGYWLINGAPTGTKAEAIDGTNGADGATWTVGTAYPTAPKTNDLFLNNTTWEVFQYNGTTWISQGCISTSSASNEAEAVVDLVIFMGQSNMAGRGVASEAPVVQEGHGFEFRAVSDPTRLYPIAEPFGVNENRGALSEGNKKTGSLVSAFAESYYAYTGVPIVGVSAAQGGKGITFWETGGDALHETISRYTAAKTYLTENGYQIRHQYMVWLQGEADGKSGMSAATYTSKLTALFGEMQKQGVEKAMVIRIGERQTNEEIHDDIILAQTELCKKSDDFIMISGKLAGVPGSEMKDDAHYKQSTYNEVGADAGKNMAYFVNTGMEPYYYDEEYQNYYPFGGSADSNASDSVTEPMVKQLILDVSDNSSPYDFSQFGTIADGKLALNTTSGNTKLTLTDAPVLSDDYDWTVEIVVGNLVAKHGMFANAGVSGAGFITVPSYLPQNAGSGAQFRFRDTDNTFQIDVDLPADYDPTAKHHFALTYNASTGTFKAYLDKVAMTITYTKGSASGTFSDTTLCNIFGGYSSTQYLKGDFYYFAFHSEVLDTSEMYFDTANN